MIGLRLDDRIHPNFVSFPGILMIFTLAFLIYSDILNIIYFRIFIRGRVLGIRGGCEAGNVGSADLVHSPIPFGKYVSRAILCKMSLFITIKAYVVFLSLSGRRRPELIKFLKLSKGINFIRGGVTVRDMIYLIPIFR